MQIALPDNKFKIGQQFIYYGDKSKRVYTVEDMIYEINSSGKVLSKAYHCSCEVLTQKVYRDFPEASLTRSELV